MSNRLAGALVILAAVIAAVTAWLWGFTPQKRSAPPTPAPRPEGASDD